MSSSRILVLPTCSICQDDEASQDTIVTMCGHVFHQGCLRTWDENQMSRRTATKCPSCNVTLRRAGSLTPARVVTLHSLTERDINDQGVSHIINRTEDPTSESRLRTVQAELNSVRETIREHEALIQQLSLEPTTLRREKEHLTTSLMLLSHSKQELEERTAKYSRDLKTERKERQEERNTRVIVDKRNKIEMVKLSEKCRIAKSEGELLHEQLTEKISENEELQSFVTEFGQEKARFHATEMSLRAQLEDSIEKFKSVRVANQVYKTKLEEAKKKYSLLEEKAGMNSRALTSSVRRCSKFHPDLSKSSVHPAAVKLMSTNRAADTSTQSSKRSARDVTHHLSSESSKRRRSTHAAHHSGGGTIKEPYRIDSRSDLDDSALPSSSTLQSSPIHFPADKDLFLPSLFGNDANAPPRAPKTKLPQQLKHHLPSASSSAVKLSTPSVQKLLALGPKIRHR